MPAFIEVQHASYCYPSSDGQQQRSALQIIELTIQAGEFVAVVGENGSGKSTLARLLTALVLPDEGRVLIGGLDTRASANHADIHSQVGIIFQRPQEQVVATTVEEDVAFGPANLGLPRQEICSRVSHALIVSGLEQLKDRPSYMLSAGEMQRLALAGVLAMQPRCIIFDETTAMLDPMGRRMVMQQAQSLNAKGITIIFITHLMEEAAQAERVLVLYRGSLVMDDAPERVFSSQRRLEKIGLDLPPAALIARGLRKYIPEITNSLITEDDLFSCLPVYNGHDSVPLVPMQEGDAPGTSVKIDHLEYTYMRGTPLAHQALHDANLTVNESAMHGIIGATGCGKSTLLQHINALLRPQSGRVIVNGINLGSDDLDVRNLRRQVGMAFQQPEDQFFEQYVGDEIAFSPRNFHLGTSPRDMVRDAMHLVGLDFDDYKDRQIDTLSGGEKRKVALASALAAKPGMVLLDEPLAGLDPQSRADISKHLQKMNALGVTLILSTHQFEGLVDILDAVSLMQAGRDILHGSPAWVFGQQEILEKSGLVAPLSVRVSWALRDRGWPIQQLAISAADLSNFIKQVFQGKPA